MRRLPLLIVLAACKKPENEFVEDPFHEPTLALQDPAPAAWKAEGFQPASGQAEFLTDVTIGGRSVDAVDGRFEGEVNLLRGVNLLTVEGVDERGDTRFVRNGVLAGVFGDPGVPIREAAALRVNQGGLDTALGLVGGMIDPAAISATLMAGNPVYQDSYGVLGWDAVNIRADIVDLQFAPPVLAAHPTSGVLQADVSLPDVLVQVYVSGDIVGFDFGVDVWVWASSADITGLLTVGAQNGKIAIDLPSAEVTLVDFGYDTSLLPGEIESYILVDTIASYIEETLGEEIVARVPPLLEEQLAALDLSFETEILGIPVSVAAEIASAGVDDGGIAAAVDLDVYMPSAGSKEYSGFLAAPSGFPDVDRDADVGLGLSDDLLNRVLFEAWRAGILDRRLSTDDGSLEPIMLAPLRAEQGTITLKSNLPPVIVANNGVLQAQIGELDVTIETPGGELGDRLDASVTAFVDLELRVEGGEIKLDLGEPTLAVTVRASDWGASNETTTRLLEEMLPIDVFMLLLGNIAFPLPSFAGISVGSAEIARDPGGAYYTGVGIDLQ